MIDHDAEMDALVAELERAGLVQSYTGDEARIAPAADAVGAAVTHRLALAGDSKRP